MDITDDWDDGQEITVVLDTGRTFRGRFYRLGDGGYEVDGWAVHASRIVAYKRGVHW